MLKIKDATGKTVGVLKDDDDAPQMIAGEILSTIKKKKEEEEEDDVKEGETKDDSDVW